MKKTATGALTLGLDYIFFFFSKRAVSTGGACNTLHTHCATQGGERVMAKKKAAKKVAKKVAKKGAKK